MPEPAAIVSAPRYAARRNAALDAAPPGRRRVSTLSVSRSASASAMKKAAMDRSARASNTALAQRLGSVSTCTALPLKCFANALLGMRVRSDSLGSGLTTTAPTRLPARLRKYTPGRTRRIERGARQDPHASVRRSRVPPRLTGAASSRPARRRGRPRRARSGFRSNPPAVDPAHRRSTARMPPAAATSSPRDRPATQRSRSPDPPRSTALCLSAPTCRRAQSVAPAVDTASAPSRRRRCPHCPAQPLLPRTSASPSTTASPPRRRTKPPRHACALERAIGCSEAHWIGRRSNEGWQICQAIGRARWSPSFAGGLAGPTARRPFAIECVDGASKKWPDAGVGGNDRRLADPQGEIADVVAAELIWLELDGARHPTAFWRCRPH